jgi:hypothetical protein
MRNREYKEMKKALKYTEHIIVNRVSSFMSTTASVNLNNVYLKVIGCKAQGADSTLHLTPSSSGRREGRYKSYEQLKGPPSSP